MNPNAMPLAIEKAAAMTALAAAKAMRKKLRRE